jgi:hypothetical protein
MATIADVKRWIRDFIPGEDYDKYVKTVTEEGEGDVDKNTYEHKYVVRIFTKSRHHYHIVVKDKNDSTGYLGCQVSNDYSLAGEDHKRGHDLSDGPLDENTWRRIVNDIIRTELRELNT